MRKTAFVRRAALIATAVAVGFVPELGPVLNHDGAGPAETDPFEQAFEDRTCNACGDTEPFWIFYSPEYDGSQPSPEENGTDTASETRDSNPAYTGQHWTMTMCLICGTIDGDLPADDDRFGRNVFRLENCRIETLSETTAWTPLDEESHMETTDTVRACEKCRATWNDHSESGKPHDWETEVTQPTCLEGGFTLGDSTERG